MPEIITIIQGSAADLLKAAMESLRAGFIVRRRAK
jgi:hypothetical protein